MAEITDSQLKRLNTYLWCVSTSNVVLGRDGLTELAAYHPSQPPAS